MSKLDDAYQKRDRSRLEVGWAALEEVEALVKEEEGAGDGAPYRTVLSEKLDILSEKYAEYHRTQNACRSYLSDSIRVARFFTEDRVSELLPYGMTYAKMIGCLIPGDWPSVNEQATQALLDWAIQSNATIDDIWKHRKGIEKQLSDEEVARSRILRSIERYLELTASLQGEIIETWRSACNEFVKKVEDKNE